MGGGVVSERTGPESNEATLIREILGENRTVKLRQGAIASPVRARLLHMAERWACPDVLLGILFNSGPEEGLWPIRGAPDTGSVSQWEPGQLGALLDVASPCWACGSSPSTFTTPQRSSTSCMLSDPLTMYCQYRGPASLSLRCPSGSPGGTASKEPRVVLASVLSPPVAQQQHCHPKRSQPPLPNMSCKCQTPLQVPFTMRA